MPNENEDDDQKLKQIPHTTIKSAETLRKEGEDVVGANLLSFAFVGESGSGKSSLINAISGKNLKDLSYAAVGYNETTHEIKQFKDSRVAHISY